MKKGVLYTIILSVVLVGVLSVLWWLYQNSGTKLLEKANLAAKASRYDKALTLVDSYIADNPDKWRGHYTRGNVYFNWGRYEQARTSLEKAAALDPSAIEVPILLAECHTAEARKAVTAKTLAEFQKGLGQLMTAQQLLTSLKPTDPKQQLAVLQAIGLGQIDAAAAHRMLSARLEEEVLAAEARRDRDVANSLREQSKAAMVKFEEYRVAATQNLLALVQKDPKRGDAATALVNLCLERQDRQSLQLAREIIMKLEDPTPVAAMMLILDDLQASGETGPSPVNRQKLLAACEVLDDILKRHPDNVQVKLARAQLTVRLGDLARAGAYCDEILKIDPRNPQARLTKAELLILQGQMPEAERQLFSLKNDFPAWPESQQAYARVALAIGKADVAIEGLRALAKLNAPGSRNKLMQAELALVLGDIDQAKQLTDDVMRKEPANGWARLIYGNILTASGNIGAAEVSHRALVRDAPNWAQARVALAQVAAQTGSMNIALTSIAEAVKLDPQNAYAKKIYASLLLREGQYENAFKQAQECLNENSDDPAAIKLFVESAERINLIDKAKEVLSQTRVKFGTKPEVLMAVAESYVNLNERATAIEVARHAASQDAPTLQDRLAIVKALMMLDRMPEAEKVLAEEIAKDPGRPDLHFQMGQICAVTGRTLPAIDQFRQAVELDRNNINYRLSLARALLESGDLSESGKVLEAVDPSNPMANVLRLQIRLIQGERVNMDQMLKHVQGTERNAIASALPYLASGQLKECVEFCQKELVKTPDDVDLRLLLGRALMAQNKQEEAIAQWEIVLKSAPNRLSTYLELAGVLAENSTVEQAAERMSRMPGAQQDMVDLAIGRLVAASGDYEKASVLLASVAERVNAAEHVRGRARILLAQCLAGAGDTRRAIAEFEKLQASPSWRKEALFGKAQLLGASRQMDAFDVTAMELRQVAQNEADTGLLRNTAELFARFGQYDRSLEVCDQLIKLAPNDARNYRIRGLVLNTAGRSDEAIASLNKAIELQPRNFSLYIAVSQILASQNKSVEALMVLRKLEDHGAAAASVALFQRGRMFTSWGLQDQAANCFTRLSTLGYSTNPQVRMALGQAFAILGRNDEAAKFLTDIPVFAEEYIPARLLLSRISPTPEIRMSVIKNLRQMKPDSQDALLEEMLVLINSDRAKEAIKVFHEFRNQPRKSKITMNEAPVYQALQAMLRSGDMAMARQLAQQAAAEQAKPQWKCYAILLTMDSDPAAAGKLLMAPQRADFYHSLLGLLMARQTGDQVALKAYVDRLTELAGASKTQQSLMASYQLLTKIATGQGPQPDVLAPRIGSMLGFGRSVVSELIASAASNPNASDEAASLLKTMVAQGTGLSALSGIYANGLLQKRPTCQWAAGLSVISDNSIENYSKVLSTLRPQNCSLSMVIASQIMRNDKNYLKSAELMAQAGKLDGTEDMFLNQAADLEYAGKPAEALLLYRQVYDKTKDPNAANNVAYMMLQLYANDQARLAEASELIQAAIIERPNHPDFRDTLGWILHLQGKHEQACVELRQAIKGLPTSAEVHYHLGVVEGACGRNDLARWHLTAAVNMGKAARARNEQLTSQMAQAIKLAQEALSLLGPEK